MRNGKIMLTINWNIVASAAIGRIIGSFVIAVFIVLGFGPIQWAEFMISGLPIFVTPGVARLSLLLVASIGLFFEWRLPVQRGISQWAASVSVKRATQWLFVMCCCLPFVAGAFYVTANSTANKPDRHLNDTQKEALVGAIKKIYTEPLPKIVVASVDDPEAMDYADEFIYLFKYYEIPVHEIYGDTPDNHLLIPYSIRQFGRTTGISISVHNPENPPELAKKFEAAMRAAGFQIRYATFRGPMPTEFMLTVNYN